MKLKTFYLQGLCALAIAMAVINVQAKQPLPGDVIDAANVADYSDYLLDSSVLLIKKGEILEVTPKSEAGVLTHPDYAATTQRNLGKAKLLDEYGTLGLADGSPWPGGTPFPDPKSALEVMVNFQQATFTLQGDDWGSENGPYRPVSRIMFIDGEGKLYKDIVMAAGQINMTGRTILDPVPSIAGYENEILRRYLAFVEPYDVKGIVTLDIQYQDQTRLPESYAYLPSFRRVRQVSTAQRADSVAGSELTQSDLGGFSDPIGLWTYKILNKKEMLVAVKDSIEPVAYPTVPTLLNNYFSQPRRKVELREVYIIEALPRFDTVYSKKVFTIDAEMFRTSDFSIYDNQGNLYKAVQQDWDMAENGRPIPTWLSFYNFQTNGASILSNKGLAVNVDVPLDLFEKASMKNFSR